MEIDAGLVAGTSVRALAAQFGLSSAAVGRHAQNHLTAQIQAEAEAHAVQILQPVATDARPANNSLVPLRALRLDDNYAPPYSPPAIQVDVPPASQPTSPSATPAGVPLNPYEMACFLRDSAVAILRDAAASGDAKLALEANRTAVGVLDRLARLMPATAATGHAGSVVQSGEWIALRSAIIAALAPYDEARVAVAEALEGLETAP